LPDITVIIVTFNHQTEIRGCLNSLSKVRGSYTTEILIIDNNSTDDTVNSAIDELAKFNRRKNWQIIQNYSNAGFTKATNQGIELSTGRYILLLNPDTRIPEDIFSKLIPVFQTDSRLGILSPQFRNADGTIQPSCRRFPRHRDLLFASFGLNRFFPGNKQFNFWQMGDFDFLTDRYVEQPQGAFLLTHRQALEDVGFLDEKFPMFFSDVDWCFRFIKKGWKILFVSSVKIIHDKGSSVYKNRFKMIWSSHRSFHLYFKKHYSQKRMRPVNFFTGQLLILLAALRSLYYLLVQRNSWKAH